MEAWADVDGKDSYDVRPLHRAAVRGSEEVVLLLLEYHVDTETKDDIGTTALHFAAQMGHHKVVKVLLEKGLTLERPTSLASQRCISQCLIAMSMS